MWTPFCASILEESDKKTKHCLRYKEQLVWGKDETLLTWYIFLKKVDSKANSVLQLLEKKEWIKIGELLYLLSNARNQKSKGLNYKQRENCLLCNQ